MIGRAAMSCPWIFSQTKQYLATREMADPPALSERWNLILRHCQLAVRAWDAEEPAIRSMRARLMAYSRSMPDAKRLREKFSDRKSTRLNSSHSQISYAVFCLKQ